ncbi:MAG: NAD(+)/NADH kinase, partial [Chloroflexota bacterium]
EFDALNEVLVARGALPRVVRVDVTIDGAPFNTVAGDGVLVATATGSTAYSLSAGGPVLEPRLRNLLLTAVCPHVARLGPVVLPAEAVVRMQIVGGNPAILSIDGQVDLAMASGDCVAVRISPYVARFVRARPPTHFYERVGHVLR